MDNRIKMIADFYGNMQYIQAVQELAELQQGLTKHIIYTEFGKVRKSKDILCNITEEIADVEIMLEQLKYLLGISEKEINDIKELKIERTLERMYDVV